MTTGRKALLSLAVVVGSIALAVVAAFFVESLIPGVPVAGRVEATPTHLVAFMLTLFGVTGIGSLVGLLYVWRVL
jgi:hypothetical protein